MDALIQSTHSDNKAEQSVTGSLLLLTPASAPHGVYCSMPGNVIY